MSFREPDGRMERFKLFIGIQVLFLVVSVFAGGFHFKVWSMLDTALLIQSIGVTALAVVLESKRAQRIAFTAAVILYLFAVIDMGVNVLVSGIVGWQSIVN